jgi:hypothetical protein
MTKIQFLKLFILLASLFLVAFCAINANKTLFIPPIEYLETTSPYIFGSTATAVYFLLKHMDAISTSTSSIKNKINEHKINKIQESYQHLNQEGVSNVILSLSLFVVAQLLKVPEIEVELSRFQLAVIALKFSCLGTMLYVAFDQILSLHTVMQYRKTIEINKKC